MKRHPTPGALPRARRLRKTMTDAERQVWRILRLHQIEGHKFRRQVPVGSYIADFACHQARLIIEIDGGQHDASAPSEMSRTRFLEQQGYRVLRFWNNDVLANLDGVYQVIATELERAVKPSPSMGEGWEGVTSRTLQAHGALYDDTPTPALPHRGGGCPR